MKLVFDLEGDIRATYAARLTAAGVPVEASDSADDLIVRFFSLENRCIEPAPRAVHWSAELRARQGEIPENYRTALAAIEAASLAGRDLNSYQSRDMAKAPWKADPQFLEWGITHFHLGLTLDPKHAGMMAGTPDLLFVSVRADALYFIEIYPHKSFSDEALFKLATKNWPHLFVHAALKGALGLEREATTEERKELRAANINVPTIGDDGTVFGPVGAGLTTSGASVAVVTAHLLPRMGPIKAWERVCRKEPERVLGMIPAEFRACVIFIELHASENDEGQIAVSATNLPTGPLLLGVGYPPEPPKKASA